MNKTVKFGWISVIALLVALLVVFFVKGRTNYGSAYAAATAVELLYFTEKHPSDIDRPAVEQFAKDYGYRTFHARNDAPFDLSIIITRERRILVISRVTKPHTFRIVKPRSEIAIVSEAEAQQFLAAGVIEQVWVAKEEWL